MTLFGWDLSHYDGNLSRQVLALAKSEGISFITHKVGEGLTNDDPYDGTVLAAARDAGIEFLGGYYIPHQNISPVAQADRCIALADRDEPWWRNFPGWFWQCDAERWSSSDRPTPAEVGQFCDRLYTQTGRTVICYASKGQYSSELSALAYRLWNANYGTNPTVGFKQAYQIRGGDNGAGWTPYSGQVPVLWQYGSNTIIAKQPTCDANAFKGTVQQFRDLIEGKVDMPITQADADLVVTTLLNRMLGSTGPTVGVALQDTYKDTRQLDSMTTKLDQIITMIGQLGPSSGGPFTQDQVTQITDACKVALESLEPLQFKTTSG